MNQDKKVCIIVPTHNRAEMLDRALRSILAQTYVNWETVIIANGCTDATIPVVRKYMSDDGRFRLIEIKDSIGGAKARNIGLDNTSGDYLAFLDDDDEWLPDKLAEQVDAIERTNSPIVGCDYHYYINGTYEKTSRLDSSVTLDDMYYENILGSYSFCMTRTRYVKGIRINEKLFACQDWDLWIKIMLAEGRKCIVVKKPLVKYHQHVWARITDQKDKAMKARSVFLKSHWRRLDIRQKRYHLLKREVIDGRQTTKNIMSRLYKGMVFLLSARKRSLYLIYMTIFEYVLLIRSRLLYGTLRGLFGRSGRGL